MNNLDLNVSIVTTSIIAVYLRWTSSVLFLVSNVQISTYQKLMYAIIRTRQNIPGGLT